MKTYLLRDTKEKVLGDKTEFHYTLEPGEDRLAGLEAEVKKWLSEHKKTAQSLLEGGSAAPEAFETIRKHLGITAGRSRQDADGFIQSILKRLS